MTKKRYKQFKRLKTVTPLDLDAEGIPITIFLHSDYSIKETHLNEKHLFADVTVRMINPKYTQLIKQQ